LPGSGFGIFYDARIGSKGFHLYANSQFLTVPVIYVPSPWFKTEVSLDLFFGKICPVLPLEKLNLKAPSNQKEKGTKQTSGYKKEAETDPANRGTTFW
jgi:hypothetical protein